MTNHERALEIARQIEDKCQIFSADTGLCHGFDLIRATSIIEQALTAKLAALTAAADGMAEAGQSVLDDTDCRGVLEHRGYAYRKSNDPQRREIYDQQTLGVVGRFTAHEAWSWLESVGHVKTDESHTK